MRKYFLNQETSKIELHFSKSDYIALPENQKKEINRIFLWSSKAGAWVSRSTKNHYFVIKLAEQLGFEDGGRIGERLTYSEQRKRKSEKAEARAERFEKYANNAEKRADVLQAELNSYRGDIAFFTQPNINSSAGRAFTRRRERIYARYERGFEEYRKSEYYRERAKIAQTTADMNQLKNPVYISNRIKECNSIIKKLQGLIIGYEEQIERVDNGEVIKSWHTEEPLTIERLEERINEILDKIEYEIDKLTYFEDAMEEVKKRLEKEGRKLYTKADIKPGYLIRTRYDNWALVLRANDKTVSARYQGHPLNGMHCQAIYAEIRDVKIPEGWTEKSMEFENPFKVGDILTRSSTSGSRIIAAYQVVKTSDKTITIQQISIVDNKPVINAFVNDKQERRSVKRSRDGSVVVNDGGWYLFRYTA
jgi:hypothetical protein